MHSMSVNFSNSLLSMPERTKPVYVLISGVVLIAINVLINQFSIDSETLKIYNALFELVLSLIVFAGLFLLFRISRRSNLAFSRTLFWLSLTMASWTTGDALYLYHVIIGVDPFISPVDLLYIAASVFFIATVLSVSTAQPASRRRNMVFIEISILILSATVIFSILLLLKGSPNLNFDAITLLMVFIYPVLDLISIWLVLIMFFTHSVKSSKKVLSLLFAGAICIFLSDLFYLLYSIYSSLERYFLVDMGYQLFYLLLLIAGLTGFQELKNASPEEGDTETVFKQNNWMIFLPGVFLIILIGLLLVFALPSSSEIYHGIIILLVTVIILFIIHQYLVVIDNIKLTETMRQINTQLESNVEQRTAELSKANSELQEEIRERQKVEAHLARSNQDLGLLNRDKDKLFSILAHDLRSPLGSMMNLSELLIENSKDFDENELMEAIAALNKSAKQTFQLLNDLLAWSTIQMGRGEREKAVFQVAEVVSENIVIVALEADKKQIEILVDIDPGLVAFADRFAIQTVLRNLLSNAVKFTPNHGTINISASGNSDTLQLSVNDNGIGISKEKQKKIFRVDTVSSSPGTDGEKGTGFGLLLCKDLISRNGGKIWFESEKGKGSTFHFSLPVHNTDDSVASEGVKKTSSRIEYQLDNTRKLGFTTLWGDFNAALLKSELKQVWSSPHFNPNYSVLIDIRKATFAGDSKDFPDFLSVFVAMPGNRINRKLAVLTETPKQVAYSTMFGQYLKSRFPLTVEVFSTYEAAMTWLGL